MPAFPPCRCPTLIETVASEGPVDFAGPGAAAAGTATRASRAKATRPGPRRRITGWILTDRTVDVTKQSILCGPFLCPLLPEQGHRVVQHVQQDPRPDRAGLLIEQGEE